MTPRPLLLALLLSLPAASGWAQKVAPGLWEHTMNLGGAGGQVDPAMAEIQKQMAAMPAGQRAQMEAMMASQGLKIGAAAGGAPGVSIKLCLTPEQAARDSLPQHDASCTQTRNERSGNKMRFAFTCAGTPPTSGEGEFTLTSDKAYSGVIKVDSARGGKPQRTEMQMAARWLGAACGDVKPRP